MSKAVVMSKRRYESLLRAEKVAREVRFLVANPHEPWDRIVDLSLSWMRKAGKQMWVRP
jgi:hypothetical protein